MAPMAYHRRWQKPKFEYCDRLCTSREQRDIEGEYTMF